MNKKVLHLLWDGNLGGVQRYILKVVGSKYWNQSEHGICFFTTGGEVIQNADLNDIPFWSLGVDRGWDFITARRELNKVIKEFKPDVIHCHCDTPAFSLQIHKHANLKRVYTEHGDTIMRLDRVWLMKLLWLFSGNYWDAILANSHFVKQDFTNRFNSLETRCDIFHNPLIENWNGTVADFESDILKVGIFGRLAWQKGIDRGLQVMQFIIKKNSNVRMYIFGVGELEQELKQKTSVLGLNDYVSFCGYSSDPLANMAAMDCTIVPSRTEPFGLVALEAQSTGTPVIGFLQNGVAEVIEDGQTGLLVEQNDIEGMAACVLQILEDKEMCNDMGLKAKHRADTLFSLKEHINALEKVYLSGKFKD